MQDDLCTDRTPTSLLAYRAFRTQLESRVEDGSAFAADVERLKREYLGLGAGCVTGEAPSQRQKRLRNLRRARVTASLTREGLLVS